MLMTYKQYNTGLLELQTVCFSINIVVTAGELLPPGGDNQPLLLRRLPLRLLVLDSLHLDIVTDQLINVRHHGGRLDVH